MAIKSQCTMFQHINQQQQVPSMALSNFSHIIYKLQTSMYQNTAKLLTHPRKMLKNDFFFN